jgi:ABC-type sulfate transport system permease component
LVPLAVNLVFYFLIAWTLVAMWRRRSILKHRALDWIVGIPAYLFGCFVAGITLLVFVVEPTAFHGWIDKS